MPTIHFVAFKNHSLLSVQGSVQKWFRESCEATPESESRAGLLLCVRYPDLFVNLHSGRYSHDLSVGNFLFKQKCPITYHKVSFLGSSSLSRREKIPHRSCTKSSSLMEVS